MPKITKNPSILKGLLENPSPLVLQSTAELQQINNILDLQESEFLAEIGHLVELIGKIPSISGELLVRVFKKCLKSATIDAIEIICEALSAVTSHNYDEDEAISELKRSKEVDAILVLSLLWKYYHSAASYQQKQARLPKIIRIVSLMAVSYPVDLMIHGNAYLTKWRDLIKQEVQNYRNKLEINRTVEGRRKESKVKVNGAKFTLIHIPL